MCKRIRLVSVRSFLVAATLLAIVSGAVAQEQSSLELARQALAQNDRQMASLYFANAIAQAQQAIPALKEYFVMMEKDLTSETDEETVSAAYTQLRQLAQNAASYVEPTQISELSKLLNELQQREDSRLAELSKSGTQVNDAERKTLLKELENALKNANDSIDGNFLKKNYDDLESAIAAASSYANDPRFATSLGKAEKRLSELQTDREFSTLLQQTQTLIGKLKQEKSPEAIKAYIGAAEGVMSNLLLAKDDVSPWLQSELDSTLKDFNDVCQKIIADNDQKILAGFIEKEGTATSEKQSLTKKINVLSELIQDVQGSSLSRETMLNKIGEYNAKLSAAVDERTALYNKWALEQIRWAFVKFQQSQKAQNVIPVFTAHLAPIDARYLNYVVQQSYGEVYTYGTAKLEGEERVQVAQISASTDKKKIEDF